MILTHLDKLSLRSPSAIALGFFDGVHLGHQAVIGRAVAHREEGLAPSVFTFTMGAEGPAGKRGHTYLMTPEERYASMERLGVERIFCPDFSQFRGMSPREYVEELLVGRLRAKVVCCGEDHHFGRDAAGDVTLLRELCGPLGVRVEVVPPVLLEDGSRVSSSAIRAALREGRPAAAARMLGRPFGFDQRVVHGKALGRKLQFPTINQQLPAGITLPAQGVYATAVRVEGRFLPGVTNIGPQPTVDGNRVLAETYIIGYQGDLYGEMIWVGLLEYLRPVQRFPSLEALQTQLERDTARARELAAPYCALAGGGRLLPL